MQLLGTDVNITGEDIIHDDVSGVFMPYFRSFATNFKQATFVCLLELFFIAVMVGYFWLIYVYTAGTFRTLAFIVLAVAAFVLFALASFMYPMLARYENTLKQHLLNSIQLVLFNLPRTFVTVVVDLVPLILGFFFLRFFFLRLVFDWALSSFPTNISMSLRTWSSTSWTPNNPWLSGQLDPPWNSQPCPPPPQA